MGRRESKDNRHEAAVLIVVIVLLLFWTWDLREKNAPPPVTLSSIEMKEQKSIISFFLAFLSL